MSQSTMLKAKGLYTYPNNLSEIPEGALTVADNVVIDRNGVVEPRRGFPQYGTTFGIGTDRAKQLMVYKDRILRHFASSLQYDNGSGTFSTFAGTYEETEAGLRIKSVESNGNFYFTTASGIKAISAKTAADFTTAAGYIRNAGGVPALDVTGQINYSTAGFFDPVSKVAYKTTWAFRDANNNLIEGATSSRLVMTNFSTTDSGTVDLTFAIPSDIGTTDTQFFYRIYRTAVLDAPDVATLSDIDPGEEMNLVIEDFPTTAQLLTRTITVNDSTPEDFRESGELLYTNPVSGEGILQSNTPPPIAKDVALFQNTVFYANTETAQQIEISLLSVSQLISLVSNISIHQGSIVNTYIFRGRPEVTEFTFDTQASTNDGGYFLINSSSNARKYFVWFDKTGSTPQPTGLDIVGRIAIKADISGATSANDVATIVETALNTTIDFNADTIGAVVTVTNSDNGEADNAVDGASPVGGVFAINVTQEGYGNGQKEITEFTFDTKVNTTNGSYFLFNDAQNINKYFVWFDKTGATPVPTGPDTVGRTALKADITAATTAAQVASVVYTQINAITNFSTSILSNVVTVTNINNGPTTDASTGLVAPGGAFAILVTQQGENYVLLSSNISPAQAIDETARALVTAINNNAAEVVNAYYLSGPDDLPGLILLQSRTIDGPSFYLTADSTTTGEEFSPALPTSGQSVVSANDIEPNALFYSKFQQPEAVPIVNKFNVGPKDKAIKRILPLRESLFILKEDGIYRVTGQAGSFILDPFDNTSNILAADSAVVLNNQIYMLSTQGVVTISDTGVSVISRPIEDKLDKIASGNFDYVTNTFGVAYESDRSYLLWTVTNTNDHTPTQMFRFNTFTTAWTRWPISKTCGIVKFSDDKLYLGAGDENFIEKERKDFARTDYADREYDLEILQNGIDGLNIHLSSVTDVIVGDVLVQTQYLTIYKFNQLLKKLDLDPGVSDQNYFSLLEASAGVNFRDSIDELAIKLDNDPGVDNTNFASSIGSGTDFIDFQDDFNIIVIILNSDSGAVFSNYPTSTGTIVFEALINSVNINTNTVTLFYGSPMIQGDVISSRGIKTDIVWAPQSFGDVSLLKQVSEGTFLFENTTFYSATISYSSDLSPNFEETPFNESGLGDWGAFVWGEQNWGGEGSQVPIRTYLPRDKQKCRFIRPQFKHIISREKFSLFGISLTVRGISSRAYRG